MIENPLCLDVGYGLRERAYSCVHPGSPDPDPSLWQRQATTPFAITLGAVLRFRDRAAAAKQHIRC